MKQKKVKVLYFVDRMRHGGIQQLAVEIAKNIGQEIQLDFLVLNDGQTYPLENTIKELGCNLYKIDTWIYKPTDYIKYYKKVDEFFREHNDYKAIHINTSSKNFLLLKIAKKYGIPVRIAHSHSVMFQSKNKAQIIMGNFFKPLLKRYATHYFACSKMAGEWLFGKKEVEKGNVKIIHNAVDYNKFKFDFKVRQEIRNEFKILDNEIVIGHVGRFIPLKNHNFLVDIFNEMYKKNKNIKLLLIGIGEKEDELKEKVKYLNIDRNVIFAGFRSDVYKIMQAFDVFVMPSLFEGVPVVGIEAQANGLPCFMSKDVITEDVKITDNFHFISLEDGAKKWAENILNSDLKRIDSKKELKKAGYFIEDMIEELIEYYFGKK